MKLGEGKVFRVIFSSGEASPKSIPSLNISKLLGEKNQRSFIELIFEDNWSGVTRFRNDP